MKAGKEVLVGLWAASHAAAFFILPCSRPVVVQRADPIVNPGALAGHVHTIMGGNGFDFSMTYEQARAATCSTCRVTADLSNYWIPNLYYQGQDGKFTSVTQPGGMLAYYLFRQDAKDPDLFYEVTFTVNDFKDSWYGDSQPFVLSNGDPTGYGLHGDFINGWDVNVLQAALIQCTDGSGSIEKCGVFQFFDDETRKGCRVPVKVDEPTQGQLNALPGCNSVQRGPANAQAESGCGATTQISQPQWGYKDVTGTLNFKYLGCARDPSGQGRTLPSAKFSSDSMTVEACIQHCDGKGFLYAGMEYAKECWCGNSVADDRLPKKGLLGAY
ncbi:hypothetical protein EsH8_V_000836 [Colletotrichum jinshuiense]